MTKSIFDKVSDDGLRISVMSRHTLNDGKTPDVRIVPGVSFDEHRVVLAPPPLLVGTWYKNRMDWGAFTREYLRYLDRPDQAKAVVELAETALRRDVTILCVEPRGANCHRVILAQRCKDIRPGLEIRHL